MSEASLHRYNRLLMRLNDCYRQVARSCDIPETALWILYSLGEPEVRTQRDICRAMLQSKQSVHSALKKLEAEGYVRLTPDPDSRRAKQVTLTAAGQALAERTSGRIRAAESAALAQLPGEGVAAFLALLEAFACRLEASLTPEVTEEEP